MTSPAVKTHAPEPTGPMPAGLGLGIKAHAKRAGIFVVWLALLLGAVGTQVLERSTTRLSVIADDRGTCVRWLPAVMAACSVKREGNIIAYVPAGKSLHGSVVMTFTAATPTWHWVQWDSPAIPNGWVRDDVMR